MDADATQKPDADLAAITARIAAYTPTVLNEVLWANHCNNIRDVVAATEPFSAEDAKSLLVVACKFTAWLDRMGQAPGPLRDVLTEASIAAFAASVRASSTQKTAGNQLGRLRRIHHALAGLPERPHPPASRSRATPYSDDEITALRDLNQPTINAAVDLALNTGIVAPATYDHPNGYDRNAWQQARAGARSAGLGLDSTRLRTTWASRQASRPVPASELIRAGLTPADLDAIARGAAPMTVEQLSLAR